MFSTLSPFPAPAVCEFMFSITFSVILFFIFPPFDLLHVFITVLLLFDFLFIGTYSCSMVKQKSYKFFVNCLFSVNKCFKLNFFPKIKNVWNIFFVIKNFDTKTHNLSSIGLLYICALSQKAPLLVEMIYHCCCNERLCDG